MSLSAEDCTTCGKPKEEHYGGIHCRGYPTYRPLSGLLLPFDALNTSGDKPVQRAYRMGSETTTLLIAAWLRVAAHQRDDRADNDGCAILLEAADLVESGRFRETVK